MEGEECRGQLCASIAARQRLGPSQVTLWRRGTRSSDVDALRAASRLFPLSSLQTCHRRHKSRYFDIVANAEFVKPTFCMNFATARTLQTEMAHCVGS